MFASLTRQRPREAAVRPAVGATVVGFIDGTDARIAVGDERDERGGAAAAGCDRLAWLPSSFPLARTSGTAD